MSIIVSVKTLRNWLAHDHVIVIDVRADLQDTTYGKRAYETSHIPGAFFLDLETDLSGEMHEHGGNHPLPEMETFVDTLRQIGVTAEKNIVVYDNGGEMYAPRAWFLLHYVGMEQVYVLDGGFSAWQRANYDISTAIPASNRSHFTPRIQEHTVVSMNEVKERPDTTILIDSRSNERYIGLVEPLYDRAGHIPGAVNYFWEDVFTDSGYLRDEAQLAAHFDKLDPASSIIVSCGSGVSACANLLALRQLGYLDVKLYVGSYSDWISYPENDLIQHTKKSKT